MRVAAVSWAKVDLWPNDGLVRLIDSLEVVLEDRRLILPRSLYSDGASVPQALWPLLDASPIRLLLPGLVHDGAYRLDAAWTVLDGTQIAITRPEADDLLRALALYVGCSELDAAKIRWAVGVGGSGAWKRKRLDWRP